MPVHNCKNPDCGKKYEVEKGDHDDGFCCYECWEAVNCGEPESVSFEELTVE